MEASDERMLVTHMGSLPRGEALTAMLLDEDQGIAPDAAAFQAAVDQATEAVVAAQLEAGIDVGNNGEMPRISFSTYVAQRVSGFAGKSARPMPLDAQRFPKWRQWVADHGLRRARFAHGQKGNPSGRGNGGNRVYALCNNGGHARSGRC